MYTVQLAIYTRIYLPGCGGVEGLGNVQLQSQVFQCNRRRVLAPTELHAIYIFYHSPSQYRFPTEAHVHFNTDTVLFPFIHPSTVLLC